MQWIPNSINGTVENFRISVDLIGLVPLRPTIAQLVERWPAIFALTDRVTYIEETGTIPAGFVVVNQAATNAMAVMQGISTVQDPFTIVGGWFGEGGGQNLGNAPYANAAYAVLSAIGLPGNIQWDQLVLIGHSFGGAVMNLVPRFIPGNFPNGGTECWVYTFGAPKCLQGRTHESEYDGYNMYRIFFGSDPVPCLPPGAMEIGDLARLVGSEARRFTSWVQPCMGLQIVPGEFPITATNPFQRNVIRIPGSTASWLLGSQVFGSQSHSLAMYSAAMWATPVGSGGGDDDPPPRSRAVPETITPSQQATALNQMVAVQSSIVQQDPQGVVTTINNNIPRVPGIKFHGIKLRGHRSVYYGDEFVTFVPSRRRQISLVRYLNKQLAGPSR